MTSLYILTIITNIYGSTQTWTEEYKTEFDCKAAAAIYIASKFVASAKCELHQQ